MEVFAKQPNLNKHDRKTSLQNLDAKFSHQTRFKSLLWSPRINKLLHQRVRKNNKNNFKNVGSQKKVRFSKYNNIVYKSKN